MNYDKSSFLAGLAVGRALWRPPERGGSRSPCISFTSDTDFTLETYDSDKSWGGTLEYSTDQITWTVWDGRTTLYSVDGCLYLRGTGNTRITGSSANRWVLTGQAISCTGNIENLLDYATVASGEHPAMGSNCFYHMFDGCTPLTTAPDLPAAALAANCYMCMFSGCTSLITAPDLPATTLAQLCYKSMFSDCTSLATAPALPVTTLARQCYMAMFARCTSLIAAPDLPATTLADECYRSMFEGCASLKISQTQDATYAYAYRIPTAGEGTSASGALYHMFTGTGGTFTGTPAINTTYYTDHAPVS